MLYIQYKDTFKPAALDFGPDNTPDILEPETARSYEVGVKGRLADGKLDYQAGLFRLDFKNLVVVTTDANGDQLFQNAGGERLEGVEAEGHWRLTPALSISAASSYHDAKFTHYIAAEGGANIDVSGNQLTLSPHVLASAGIIYQPAVGAVRQRHRQLRRPTLSRPRQHREGRFVRDRRRHRRLSLAALQPVGQRIQPDRPAPPGHRQRIRRPVLLPAAGAKGIRRPHRGLLI